MPESRDKKELGGLARSIDSLFAEAVGGDESGATARADLSHERAPPPAPDSGRADLPGRSEAPPRLAAPARLEPTHRSETPPREASPPPPEAQGASEAVPPPLPTEAEVGIPPGPPPLPVDEGVPAPDAFAEPAPAIVRPEAGQGRSDEREPLEPAPLELAVASFVAGEGDAAEVSGLADRHVEAREFEPVAIAVERLVHEAGDPPRGEVLELARKLMTPIVRARVVKRLGHERDEARRADYHRMCTTLGVDMAEAIRDEMADETDRSARRAYFDALVAMGELSRPVIEAMAEDDNVFLARNGVAILGVIGGPRATELTLAALANPDARVRREALHSMALLKMENADQLVIGLLDDTDDKVRIAAVTTAGELKVERAVRHLAAMLDGEQDPEVILPVMHALGRIGDPGAVPAIEKQAARERFGKPRTEVRIAAHRALAHIGTPHARRLLNKAVNDKDPAVKAVAKELLHMR